MSERREMRQPKLMSMSEWGASINMRSGTKIVLFFQASQYTFKQPKTASRDKTIIGSTTASVKNLYFPIR